MNDPESHREFSQDSLFELTAYRRDYCLARVACPIADDCKYLGSSLTRMNTRQNRTFPIDLTRASTLENLR
jgi:hypothetical protein